MGGWDSSVRGVRQNTVYLYNATTEEFDLLDERLSVAKDSMAAILVGEDLFPEC